MTFVQSPASEIDQGMQETWIRPFYLDSFYPNNDPENFAVGSGMLIGIWVGGTCRA